MTAAQANGLQGKRVPVAFSPCAKEGRVTGVPCPASLQQMISFHLPINCQAHCNVVVSIDVECCFGGPCPRSKI